MGLFFNKKNPNKLLDEALLDYKASRFDECYKKVCDAADMGSARAYFCKALLIYNDNIAPDSEPEFEVLEDLTRRSVEGGYAFAYGFYAYVLYMADKMEELFSFLETKSKIKDGVYLSYKASYWFGLYTDDEKADRKTIIETLKEAVAQLFEFNKKLSEGKTEYEECALYNPYGKYSLKYTYAKANFVLSTVYYCEDNWSDRRAFMNAFEETMKYMPSPDERFRAARQYMRAILRNVLGMSDFSEANRAMGILNECYNALDDDGREAYDESYEELYNLYDEFYDTEKANRQNRDVTYSDGYAGKNDISFGNVASAVVQGAVNWANSSSESSTKTVYTVNGKSYTRGEQGYLYDEQGYKSDYRVDDYARLHDGNDRELGYFNNDGLFIDN